MGAKTNPYSYYLNCVKLINIVIIAMFCGHKFGQATWVTWIINVYDQSTEYGYHFPELY